MDDDAPPEVEEARGQELRRQAEGIRSPGRGRLIRPERGRQAARGRQKTAENMENTQAKQVAAHPEAAARAGPW